eukprot:SM000069S20751  [mRNA]  locus=s69:606413:607409:- [translate_table: standard]
MRFSRKPSSERFMKPPRPPAAYRWPPTWASAPPTWSFAIGCGALHAFHTASYLIIVGTPDRCAGAAGRGGRPSGAAGARSRSPRLIRAYLEPRSVEPGAQAQGGHGGDGGRREDEGAHVVGLQAGAVGRGRDEEDVAAAGGAGGEADGRDAGQHHPVAAVAAAAVGGGGGNGGGAGGRTFFLDGFAARQWDDPAYDGTVLRFDRGRFVERVHELHADGGGAPLVPGYAVRGRCRRRSRAAAGRRAPRSIVEAKSLPSPLTLVPSLPRATPAGAPRTSASTVRGHAVVCLDNC